METEFDLHCALYRCVFVFRCYGADMTFIYISMHSFEFEYMEMCRMFYYFINQMEFR